MAAILLESFGVMIALRGHIMAKEHKAILQGHVQSQLKSGKGPENLPGNNPK